jgi:cytochrome P450
MPPIDLDPPLQTEFRQLLNRYFTSAAVRRYAPVIATLGRQLIDRFATRGECELTNAFARPLPALVLGWTGSATYSATAAFGWADATI